MKFLLKYRQKKRLKHNAQMEKEQHNPRLKTSIHGLRDIISSNEKHRLFVYLDGSFILS